MNPNYDSENGTVFDTLDSSPPYVANLPDPTAGLNRKQRRAQEARFRKFLKMQVTAHRKAKANAGG